MAEQTLAILLDSRAYDKAIDRSIKGTDNLTKSQEKLVTSNVKLDNSARLSGQALTQFNDFAQQAAYSGGNLNQIVIGAFSQFDQLRSITGSAASAMSLLKSAIFSIPGAITIAITAFSLLSTIFKGSAEEAETLEDKLKKVDDAMAANEKSIGALREQYGKYAGTIKEVLKQKAALAKFEAAQAFQKESKELIKGVAQLSYGIKNHGKITQEQADIIVNSWTSLSHAAQTGNISKFNTVFDTMSKSLAKTGFDATNLDKDMQELWKSTLRLAEAGAAVDPLNEATGKGAVKNAEDRKKAMEEAHKAELDFNNALSASDAIVRAENEKYWERRKEEEAKITEELTKRNATIIEGLMKANELVNSQLGIEEARLAGEQQLIGYYGEQLNAKRDELEIEKQIAHLRASGRFSEDELKGFQDRLKALSDTKREIQSIRSVHDTVLKGMESGLDKFVETGKLNFKDFAGSIIKDLIKIQLKAQASKIFSSFLGSFGGFFGGGKAEGGPVKGNTPYLVGEEGPELFVPGKNGAIIPNDKMGGGGGTTTNNTVVNQNFNITGYTDKQLVAKMQATIAANPVLISSTASEGNRRSGQRSFR